MSDAPAYAELHCLSNFTFLRGASSAIELFRRAQRMGYTALAITDECSLAGIVRAHEAAEKTGLKLIVGAEFTLVEGTRLVLLVIDHDGYTNLCRIITQGRRASPKGSYRLARADLEGRGDGLIALLLPDAEHPTPTLPSALRAQGRGYEPETFTHEGLSPPLGEARGRPGGGSPCSTDSIAWAKALFGERVYLAVELHRGAADDQHLTALLALAEQHALTPVACGDVHMHVRSRRALQDTLTAIRLNTTIAEAGFALHPNGERHLRSIEDLAEIYPRALLDASVDIAAQCRFSMKQLRYEYPHELVPAGLSASEHLRNLTEAGARWRWPEGTPAHVRVLIEKELDLIAQLRYEAFFLTVEDIVRFARSKGILCQGRGSSANSVVCFCLGITEVDPARMSMLFERFVSKERNEPPDIDVDFEHERREEVIQYIYRKYGRTRTALAATVIAYRARSAVRDVGRALGLPLDTLERIGRALGGWDDTSELETRLREQGFDPQAPVLRKLARLAGQLQRFPRHLSQHVGGFVISERDLAELVPVENAAMPDRTIIQWDKDDLDAMNLLKVDVLALGMLSCLRRCFDLVHALRGQRWTIATLPPEDPATYAMIQAADTLGVFQIESRAQMAMLPRLKPQHFYDLVIEVAIVRPGPIQGKMVHPYLHRRQHPGEVRYESPKLEPVLARTLGVPLFQEQVMQIAMVAADFTPGEADELRRSMAAWKRHGGLEHLRERLFSGMRKNGYSDDFQERIFEQIKGFGSYGFPESHAASFAILVYASCWLKCHEPAAYACALLNSLPMGFYAPAQIVQDVERHGVQVRPADVVHSDWDCTLESDSSSPDRTAPPTPVRPEPVEGRCDAVTDAVHGSTGSPRTAHVRALQHALPQPALRLGLCLIKGLAEECGQRIMDARRERPFIDVRDLVERARLDRSKQARLADADALRSLSGHRHRARWDVEALTAPTPLLGQARIAEEKVELVQPSLFDDVITDYDRVGLSLKAHPVSLVRSQLQSRRVVSAKSLEQRPDGARVRIAGLVTVRQRPQTASGVTFVTLEDETGVVNIVVWRRLADAQRRVLRESRLLALDGRIERADGVQHVVAERLHDYSALLDGLAAPSRDFH
ncbi:MAG: error-prone DNA polymerase [Xanthomonadales bacterium]|nr:error-prone DNA polymerase [Xanthomonadales bacterium]